LGRQILKILAILVAGLAAAVLLLGGGVYLLGVLEGPTICELVIDNRGTSALEQGSILLNRRPGKYRERSLPTITPHSSATFEFDHFYTEPGGELTFHRTSDSLVRGQFDYIDGGETWRYRMIVTDDSVSFNGVRIERNQLKSRRQLDK
jgi:hypothetical protein